MSSSSRPKNRPRKVYRLTLPNIVFSKPIYAFLIIVVNAANVALVPEIHNAGVSLFLTLVLNGLVQLFTSYEAEAPPVAQQQVTA